MFDLTYLESRDNLKPLKLEDKKGWIHDDHRFVLPLVYNAQEKGLLPKPCKIVSFDFHKDTGDVKDELKREITELIKKEYSLSELIEVTERLGGNDDDWIQAGMNLGIFSDAIIFGVNYCFDEEDKCQEITDILGKKHHIEIRSYFPGVMLGFKGELSDLLYKTTYKHLWDLLGWEYVGNPEYKFKFKENNKKILLDIDLDAFTMEWDKFTFPWEDEVFEDRFHKPGYGPTSEWSGKKFNDDLINQSGLITIAREPGCCGGEEKMDIIYSKVKKYLFNDKLIDSYQA